MFIKVKRVKLGMFMISQFKNIFYSNKNWVKLKITVRIDLKILFFLDKNWFFLWKKPQFLYVLLSGLLFMSWCFQHNSLWRKPYSIDFSKILYAANKKKCFFPKINILDMLYSTIFFSAGEKAWNMCSYVILVFEYRLFYIKSVKMR